MRESGRRAPPWTRISEVPEEIGPAVGHDDVDVDAESMENVDQRFAVESFDVSPAEETPGTSFGRPKHARELIVGEAIANEDFVHEPEQRFAGAHVLTRQAALAGMARTIEATQSHTGNVCGMRHAAGIPLFPEEAFSAPHGERDRICRVTPRDGMLSWQTFRPILVR